MLLWQPLLKGSALGQFTATQYGFVLPETGIFMVFMASVHETTRLPVRSAIYKQCTGGLVVRWVTTSESPLLYVFGVTFVFFFWRCFSPARSYLTVYV